MILGLYSVFRPAPQPTSWSLPTNLSSAVAVSAAPKKRVQRKRRPARGWFYRLMAG